MRRPVEKLCPPRVESQSVWKGFQQWLSPATQIPTTTIWGLVDGSDFGMSLGDTCNCNDDNG
jgi:hypothetical protein